MRVIRSAGQNVSPSDDGRLFDQAFSDGLFEDATIAANGGNSISIGALYGIICGRDFTAEAQTIAATLPESDTATGYVYVEIDTSSDDIITIGTALAPFTPTYEDINTNGAVVQMIIAQYEASAVAVTSVTPTYTTASAGAVDAGSVATIETSPTVAAHAVGDIILYGGKIYEVTAAISIGESLVIGTNIVATSIGDEISALNAGLGNVTLWTNSSPSADFTARTISLDLSNYSAVVIYSASSTTAGAVTNALYTPLDFDNYPTIYSQLTHYAGISNSSVYFTVRIRTLTISETGIVFDAGSQKQANNNTPSTSNSICIPLAIYGIK